MDVETGAVSGGSATVYGATGDNCNVCDEPLSETSARCALPCGHALCSECIGMWIDVREREARRCRRLVNNGDLALDSPKFVEATRPHVCPAGFEVWDSAHSSWRCETYVPLSVVKQFVSSRLATDPPPFVESSSASGASGESETDTDESEVVTDMPHFRSHAARPTLKLGGDRPIQCQLRCNVLSLLRDNTVYNTSTSAVLVQFQT